MARAITIYANAETARLQDAYGQPLSVAAVRLLFAETATITLAVVDDDRVAVDLTGITAGWALALKSPADLDGATLLASKAGTVTDAEGGLVEFAFSGTDLSSSSMGTYLADPLAPPFYGKPVAIEIYRMPASDKITYAVGAITVARGAYDPSADGAPVNQPYLARAFGTGADGALVYTGAGGWTLAGAAMTSGARWTVDGATLTLLSSLDLTTGSIGAGAVIVAGTNKAWNLLEIRSTGQFTVDDDATIDAAYNGIGTGTTAYAMSDPGTPVTSTSTGAAQARANESQISLSRAGGSGAGGGTGTGGNLGGSRHTPASNTSWTTVRIATGSVTAGTTGAGANGDNRTVAAFYAGSDPDMFPRLCGASGAAGGGGAVTTSGGTGTGGMGGTPGLGGGVLVFRCWGFSNAGTIRANGQDGGAGGAGVAAGGGAAGGGGGGSGGGGGQVVVYYGPGGYSNTGTLTAAGGEGGTGGAGSGAGNASLVGNDGGNGAAGSDGQVWTKQVA